MRSILVQLEQNDVFRVKGQSLYDYMIIFGCIPIPHTAVKAPYPE